MNNNGYGPFGQPIWTEEDYLQAEMERLRFRIEQPEEYKKRQEELEKASEEIKKRIEAAKNLPKDYFDGWKVYEVKKDDSLWNIAKKCLGSGTKYTEIIKNNDQQLPFRTNSVKTGTKLRLRKDES